MNLKSLVSTDKVETRIQELLGDRKSMFVTSLLQCVNSSHMLQKAEPMTVLNAAMTAASLNLPISNQLGYAYIVPYNNNKKLPNGQWEKRTEAQFQIGYKGFIQLALRTNQYHRINAIPVYENQYKGWNPLTEELKADFNLSGEGLVMGYVAFFRLVNGFEKVVYWSHDKVTNHGQKYSKSFSSQNGQWQKGFDGMALKTVLKAALSKYGPLSVDMQTAIQYDQSVQRIEGAPEYIDNEDLQLVDENGNTIVAPEDSAILEMINKCNSDDELDLLLETHSEITKSIKLTSAVGARRKALGDEEE